MDLYVQLDPPNQVHKALQIYSGKKTVNTPVRQFSCASKPDPASCDTEPATQSLL